MNKKRLVSICAVMALAAFCLSLLVACDMFGGGDEDFTPAAPKEYTIQYTDDDGLHTLKVTENTLYALETIPEKKGYKFLGLFDAQEGGKQYVLANGTAVSAFADGKNIVLYPQFTANEYTVILDYQDAKVTGERQFSVEYSATLPALPTDVAIAHKVFVGWFTAPNCQGVKVADQYGLVPVVSVLNDNNFDLSGDIIYLYAGFEVEKFSVTCYFGSSIASEELQIEYDTPVSQIVPDTRVDGKAPIAWSQTQGGEVFNGKITGNTTLYALEYAPVIELDVNGGDKIIPLIAREGTSIILPTPTKDLAKFLYWEDAQGSECEITVMPSQSLSLKAVWQGKLVFDENGGTDVTDISEKAGETIELPTPEKEGYVFAGWYTTDKEVYSSTKMPVNGVALKAGWYLANEKSITLIDNNTDNKLIVDSNTLSARNRLKIDLSEDITDIPANGVDIDFEITFSWGNTYKYIKADGQVALYDGDVFNTDYQLAKKSLSHNDQWDHYLADSLTGKATIHNNILYFYYAGYGQLKISLTGGYGDDVAFYNIKVKITYPDTSKLYL